MALLAACAPALLAAQGDHAPLKRNATLEFAAILDSAVQHAPESLETAVRRDQAEAFAATGRSLLAGRPSFAVNYYDDRPFDNNGQVETQYGIQMPLWRPGERRNSAELGGRYEEQVEAWQQALRMDVAGRLRTVLADIHEAEVLLELERAATSTAEEVLRVAEAQFAAGAIARVELMQSQNLLLDQRRRLFEAEAALVDGEIGYEFLTGLDELPAVSHTETQNTATEVDMSHPLLTYLQSEVDVLDGLARQSEAVAKGSPALSFGARHERADRLSPSSATINLELTIPFGGSAHVSSRASAARREKVDAEVRLRNTLRELQLGLHDAEHELSIVRLALPLAREQADLGAERLQLAQAAFAQGELTMAQVLPAAQEARAASRELALLTAREQRLILQYNQYTGVLP
jgi:cobalt-zinc-cadmium efflux system outer membrane protein